MMVIAVAEKGSRGDDTMARGDVMRTGVSRGSGTAQSKGEADGAKKPALA